MEYLILDPYAERSYFLGGEKGCMNSGWHYSIIDCLTTGIHYHADENQNETTVEWLKSFPDFIILLSHKHITYEYVKKHYPELLL